MSEVLAKVMRNGIKESLHRGSFVFVNIKGEILSSIGDPLERAFMRSAAKPFQLLSLFKSGAYDRYRFDLKEIAVMTASHNGDEEHTSIVSEILKKLGFTAEYLKCGLILPLDSITRRKLIINGEKPSQLHSPCSGKHATMLAVCKQMNWNLDDYTKPEHPLQKYILEIISEITSLSVEKIGLGVDDCGVPSYVLPLYNMALGFSRLANQETLSKKYQKGAKLILGAINQYPQLAAGRNIFTTKLLAGTEKDLIAKEGSEGVYCLGIPKKGIGFALKIEDGNFRPVQVVVLEALRQMGLLTEKDKDDLAAYFIVKIRDNQKRVVGEIIPAFSLKEV